MTWQDQQILIVKVANSYLPDIIRAIKTLRKEALRLYQEDRVSDLHNKFFDEEMYKAIAGIYRRAGGSMARYIHKTMPSVRQLEKKRAIGQMGISEDWLTVVKIFLEKYGFTMTTKIIGTQRKKIVAIFQKAAEEGWGYKQIADYLLQTKSIQGDAERIARTEAHRAAMVGSIAGARTLPYAVQKEWLSGRDGRTRRPPKSLFDHYNINGQIRELEEPFEDGEKIMQPGDIEANEKNTIRCRCVLNYIPKRDERGMLILK